MRQQPTNQNKERKKILHIRKSKKKMYEKCQKKKETLGYHDPVVASTVECRLATMHETTLLVLVL